MTLFSGGSFVCLALSEAHSLPPLVRLFMAWSWGMFGLGAARGTEKGGRQDKRSLRWRLSYCLHSLFFTGFGGSEIFVPNALFFLRRFGGCHG